MLNGLRSMQRTALVYKNMSRVKKPGDMGMTGLPPLWIQNLKAQRKELTGGEDLRDSVPIEGDEPFVPPTKPEDERRELRKAVVEALGTYASEVYYEKGEDGEGQVMIAVLANLGDFSGSLARVSATRTKDGVDFTASAKATGSARFESGQVTLEKSSAGLRLVGRGMLRDIGMMKGHEASIEGELADGKTLMNIGAWQSEMRLPLGFVGGQATLPEAQIDLGTNVVTTAAGTAEASNRIFGGMSSTDLKITNNEVSGTFDLVSREINIPGDDPVFTGNLEGRVKVTPTGFETTNIGGSGELFIPAADKVLPIYFDTAISDAGVGDIKAGLTGPVDLGDYLTLDTLDVTADPNAATVKCIGAATLKNVPNLEPAVARFEADSKEKIMRVTVARVAVTLPDSSPVKGHGVASNLVLDAVAKGFSTDDVTIDIEVPIVGQVHGQTSIKDNKLQKTTIDAKKHITFPQAAPLFEGDLDTHLEFNGTTFEEAKSELPLDLRMGEKVVEKAVIANLEVGNAGVLFNGRTNSPLELSPFLILKQASLTYSKEAGFGGNADLTFTQIAGQSVDLPMPLARGKTETKPIQQMPSTDAFGYELNAGYSLARGPFLEGKVVIGPTSKRDAVAGKMFVPAASLLGEGSASFDVVASGYQLTEADRIDKRLIDFKSRRFPIMRLPIGGIYAEAGAELDFAIEADPIFADFAGRLEGVNLRTLRPSSASLSARMQGGMTGRMLGAPRLSVGAFIGAPQIFRLSGGLKAELDAVIHAAPMGSVDLKVQDGQIFPHGTIDQRLYFGMTGALIPTYDLTVLDGAIKRSGAMAPLKSVELFEQKEIARFPVELGSLGPPRAPKDTFEFSMAKVEGEAPMGAPEVKTVAPEEVKSEVTSEPGETSSGAFGEAAWGALDKAYGEQGWYQVAKQALDFVSWVVGALKITEGELNSFLTELGKYVDIKKLNESFFSNFKKPDGKQSKIGLIEAIARAVFGRGDGTMEEDKEEPKGEKKTEVFTFRLGLATIRLKKGTTGRAIVMNDPFAGGAFALDQEKTELNLDESDKVEGGTLFGKLSMGTWGEFEELAFPLLPGGKVNPEGFGDGFKAGSKTKDASMVVPGHVAVTVQTSPADIEKVEVAQSAALAMPSVVGGFPMKTSPVKSAFAQRERGSWSLTSANTVVLPFGEGQVRAQLHEYAATEAGVIAKGTLWVEVDGIGQAAGDVSIVEDKVEAATLAFESTTVGFPESNPFIAGKLQGGLNIKDGSIEDAKVGVKASARLGRELKPIGELALLVKKVDDRYATAFVFDVDASAIEGVGLDGFGELTSLRVSRDETGNVGARGTFDLELKQLGEVKGAEVTYTSGGGLGVAATLPIDQSFMKGALDVSYSADRMSITGRGHFAPPGMNAFDGELQIASDLLRVKVESGVDVLALSFGDTKLSAGIDELIYDRRSGCFSGQIHVGGDLPIIGPVVGEAALGDTADPKAPLLRSFALRATNPDLKFPSENPAIEGKLDKAAVSYGPKGIDAQLEATNLKLNAPGLGKGASVTFAGKIAENVPSGVLSYKPGQPTPGDYFHLQKLDGKLTDKGDFDAEGQVVSTLPGLSGGLAARVNDKGFSVAATSIGFGTPFKDRFWADGITVGYDSVTGMYFRGNAYTMMGGVVGALKLDYGGNKTPGKKTLDAMVAVKTTLVEGGGGKEVKLPELGPFTTLLTPIIPPFLSLFGEFAASASLKYTFEPLVLTASGMMTGIDLSERTFDQIAFAPKLTGGAIVELSGGPSVGLIAALGMPGIAYAKGNVGFSIGARARMLPTIQGLVRYQKGALAGGLSLNLPLYLSAVGTPWVSAEVGILNGYFKKDIKTKLDEIQLFEPRKLFELNLGAGLLAEPGTSVPDMASMIPTNPLEGEKGSTKSSGQTIEDTAKAPEQKASEARSVEGMPTNSDLTAQKGAFSLTDVKNLLLAGFAGLRGSVKRAWEAITAIGDKLKSFGSNMLESGKVSMIATAQWVRRWFGGDANAAREAVFESKSFEDIKHIDKYEGLRLELFEVRDLHKKKEKSLLKQAKESRPTNIVGYMVYGSQHQKDREKVMTVKISGSLTGAMKNDLTKAQEGDSELERLATYEFALVMMKHGVSPVLNVLRRGLGDSLWDLLKAELDDRMPKLTTALKKQSGQVRELWKTATKEQLVTIKHFLMHCCDMTLSGVKELCEEITRTYWSGMLGGDGHTVRANFKAAGMVE